MSDNMGEYIARQVSMNQAANHVDSSQGIGGSQGEGIFPGIDGNLSTPGISLGLESASLDSAGIFSMLQEARSNDNLADLLGSAFEVSGPLQGIDKIKDELTVQPFAGQNFSPETFATNNIKPISAFSRGAG